MAGALSSYRNYLGLAKVTTDGYVNNSGGLAIGATSVTVSVLDGTPTTSMSAIFLDGPNTEVCTISAYTGGVATISATVNAHPQGCYILFQPTASLGATVYLPMRSFKIPDKIDQLYDTNARGSLVSQVGVAQGMRSSEWSFEGDVFGDTFGYLLAGIFGSEDFSSGTPNAHAFGVNNQSNGQPDRYALFVYDDVNTRVVVGRFSELTINYDPKALISYSAKMLARSSGVVPNGTQSYSTLPPIASWRAGLTISSTAVGSNVVVRTPLSYSITLSRAEAENIPTMNGTQDPYDSFVGALVATGKISFVKQDDLILTDYEQGNLATFSLAFVQGTGSTEIALAIQTTEANYDSVEPMLQGKAYNTEEAAFTALGNTTDATTAGGGLSPCKVTLKNAIGSGVYL